MTDMTPLPLDGSQNTGREPPVPSGLVRNASLAVDNEMLAAVVTGAGEAIGIIDDTGLIHYVNHFGARHLGFTPDELIGTNFVDLTHPDDLERNIEMIVTSGRGEEGGDWFSPPVLTRARHRDGTYRYVSVTGSVVARTEHQVFLSILLHPADDFVAMHAALQATIDASAPDEVLERILEITRWQRDRPFVSLVRRTENGPSLLGDALPRELGGETWAAGSPWDAAWKGEPCRGTADDLRPELRDIAAAHNLHAFWIRPVRRAGHDVAAVFTIWYPTHGRSLLAWELTIDFMIDAMSVALAYHDQRVLLEHSARHDALTGLPNRRAFLSAIAELVVQPEPAGAAAELCAVLYIDLDGFKPVNDSFGHGAGDVILAEVGDRLRATVLPSDLVARLGGDEFCIFRSGTSDDDAMALAGRVLGELGRPFPFLAGDVIDRAAAAAPARRSQPVAGERLSAAIGASIGVAVGPSAEAEDLVARADRALYTAKSLGGRTAHLAD